ncbi:glutathione S-transferase [Rhodovulum iodosum]|uniref:Glutathione S-transferase n=1 Tax=Rhodovulum iodosum TaxID=68291 RepID=A0ABV3XQB7_9RHOB|nr:glutathione transferase GstA [Rhodovulum robiginosum]RSK39404.1 glutathione transferase GstA [Rhodovulum robiginosum]
MTLYFMPGACSLAPHIALREANLEFDLVEVDYRTRRTDTGTDYRAVNPKGTVPALRIADGEVLTEVPVILQFLADGAPDAGLLPASGLRRLRALEWLNFISTEIHKSFSPLFRPTTPDGFIQPGKAHLRSRLVIVERHLSQHTYLMGDDFSLADVFLFTVCRWLADQDISLADWPALKLHSERIRLRPSVRKALDREGCP